MCAFQFVGVVLQSFGHAVTIKSKDGKSKYAFGSRDEQLLRKWWDAMYMAQYVTLTLNITIQLVIVSIVIFTVTALRQSTVYKLSSKLDGELTNLVFDTQYILHCDCHDGGRQMRCQQTLVVEKVGEDFKL